MEGNDLGFSTAAVYRTYDEYVNDSERKYIEYFLRDAYAFYGYDFHYYDGQPMTVEQLDELTENFSTIDQYIRETWQKLYERAKVSRSGERVEAGFEKIIQEQLLENKLQKVHDNRKHNTRVLMRGLRFLNRNYNLLRMMPKLELDPTLLEQPLYH